MRRQAVRADAPDAPVLGVTKERGHMTKEPTTINATHFPEPLLLDPEAVRALRHVVDYALHEERLHRQQGRQPRRHFYRNVRALSAALGRPPDEDSINLVWHIEDVLSVRPNLTTAQARAVLRIVHDRHDANCGVNWCTLETVADDMFPEAGEPA
jgi:hypothetical protein